MCAAVPSALHSSQIATVKGAHHASIESSLRIRKATDAEITEVRSLANVTSSTGNARPVPGLAPHRRSKLLHYSALEREGREAPNLKIVLRQ